MDKGQKLPNTLLFSGDGDGRTFPRPWKGTQRKTVLRKMAAGQWCSEALQQSQGKERGSPKRATGTAGLAVLSHHCAGHYDCMQEARGGSCRVG